MRISEQRVDEFAIVRVEGTLGRGNQVELASKLEDLLRQGVRGVAMDFGQLEYIDSAGLGACAASRKQLKDTGNVALVMFGASPYVVRMWRMIRLDLAIPFFDSEEEAFAQLRSANCAKQADC